MKRPFFVFAHLPKCAGTTFIDILRRNLGPRFYHDNGLLQNYQYSVAQMSRIVALYPKLDCIASHRYSFAIPVDDPACPRTVKAFTFVRDPVERTLSHYFFHRQRPWINTEPVNTGLLEYFQKFDRTPNCLVTYKDGQTRLLAGLNGFARIEELVRAGHVWVFPMHRFDDAMLVLEKSHPDFFPDCSYAPRNSSTRDQPVPDEVRQLILKHQEADLALVRLAGRQLDAELQRLYPDPSDLAAKRSDFAARCANFVARNQPPPPISPPPSLDTRIYRWFKRRLSLR